MPSTRRSCSSWTTLRSCVGIVVRIGDEQAVAVFQRTGLDALEDLREVRVADRRHREPDGAGAGGHQGAGEGVGRVAELVDGVQHGLAGVGQDRPGAVEDVRDGRHGHARAASHVGHGRHRVPLPDGRPQGTGTVGPRPEGIPFAPDVNACANVYVPSPA